MTRLAVVLVLLASAPLAWSHDVPQRRSVSVNGHGEVLAKPDRARLSLGVEVLRPALKDAQAEVNRIVRAYLTEAKALGAKDEQIQTSGVTIQPEYAWLEKTQERRLTGYRVHRQIEVQVTDLERLGDFILAATKVGVNQVSPPALESSRAAELQRESLVKAAQDARARAQALAGAMGRKLGAIWSITAQDATPPPYVPMRAMRMEAAQDGGNAEMGIATGEIKFTTHVQADFDLE